MIQRLAEVVLSEQGVIISNVNSETKNAVPVEHSEYCPMRELSKSPEIQKRYINTPPANDH